MNAFTRFSSRLFMLQSTGPSRYFSTSASPALTLASPIAVGTAHGLVDDSHNATKIPRRNGAISFHTKSVDLAQSVVLEDCASPVFNVQDEADFKKRVLESKTPVIVDFHARWCGPCKLLLPRLEAIVSAKKGQVNMAKVDIDEQNDLACQYNVRSVPTVLGIKNGKVVEQFIGLADDDKIKGLVEKLLN